jgi:hypothetical protein
LLGLPGAPGCTTTGVARSVCCDHTAEQKNPGEQKKAAAVLTLIRSRFRGASVTRPAARDSALNIICASFVDTAIRFACGVCANPQIKMRQLSIRCRTKPDSRRQFSFACFPGLRRPIKRLPASPRSILRNTDGRDYADVFAEVAA